MISPYDAAQGQRKVGLLGLCFVLCSLTDNHACIVAAYDSNRNPDWFGQQCNGGPREHITRNTYEAQVRICQPCHAVLFVLLTIQRWRMLLIT